ncbi:hypothetical protein [Labilithrix luteola]|nr:hypothetical protein [Labilithrix luteola]
MRRTGIFVALPAFVSALLVSSVAAATTYQVGPTRTNKNLGAIANSLKAGDVVEVDGNATYPAVTFEKSGTSASKITIRGIKVGGKRPIISGGTNTIEASGDHYVFEGLEITGGSFRCFFHHADDITIRDSVVHDCPKQGILGADNDSGSMLLEYTEVYACGGGDKDHQVYMATDEVAHPGSVFRMQFCYVHDANGGNSVKSRAERNEIYYNWIEGALYHELELIGPDPAGGVDASLKREDSDVVGNVLKKTSNFFFARVGGDGTGESKGRYRFMNNTFIGAGASSTAFRVFDGIDSVEMHDNVFWWSGGTFNLMRTAEASWVAGEQVSGIDNWIRTGSAAVPAGWTGTLTGTDPLFVNAAANDFTPKANSPLVDKGTTTTASPAGHAFPSPLAKPLFHPPRRTLMAPGTAEPRPEVGVIDIGAFEYGTGPFDAGVPDSGSPEPDGGSSGSDGGMDPDGGSSPLADGGSSSGGSSGSSGTGSSGGSSGSSGSSGGGSSNGGVGPVAPESGGGGDDSSSSGCGVGGHAGGGGGALLVVAAWLLARRRARAN